MEEEIEEIEIYKGIPAEVISFITDVIHTLRNKKFSPEGYRFLDLALVNLHYYPLPPLNNLHIGFRDKDTTYTLFYSDYRIELSVFVSDNGSYGSDHYQEIKHLYAVGGDTESIGFFEDFRDRFLQTIHELPIEKICIRDEE